MNDHARAVFSAVAGEHPRTNVSEGSGETVWQVGATPFVVLRGATAEFRLRPDMVAAALRTPGTGPSSRGPEWISFAAPDEPERYDVDRLRAWFAMAARLAGG
jgi:hypothetical protein